MTRIAEAVGDTALSSYLAPTPKIIFFPGPLENKYKFLVCQSKWFMLSCQFIAHSSLHHYTVCQKLILLPQKHEKELLW